jgi:hypothetical protein
MLSSASLEKQAAFDIRHTFGGVPNFQPGSVISVDSGANQETVQVGAVNGSASPPTFTATFNKAHTSGFNICVPKFGNPGPQPNFSTRDNSAVILYAAVVD